MKKQSALILFLVLQSVIFNYQSSIVNAQCTPDLGCTTDICPDVGAGLPDGTVGVFYSEVITVVIPLDSSGFTVDSVALGSISGLPPGLTYICTPPSCTWPGNSFGCFVISGTPTDTSTYNLVLNFTFYLNGLPPQPGVTSYNSITISGGMSCTPNTTCTTDLCPDVGAGLPDGTVGVGYSETITVVIPLDSSGFTVDSVRLGSISGLPPGLTYICTPPSCTWPGNSFGCFVISGTPTDTGLYNLTLNFTFYLNGLPPQLGSVPYNSITINGSCNVLSSFTSNTTEVCEGGTINFTNTSSGATSYNWLEDGNSFATSTNTSRTFGAAGTFTISLVADSSSCTDTSNVVITVNALPGIPTITAGGPTTFCQGDSVTLTSSAATAYSWSSGQSSQSIMVSTSGSYTVTITDPNGCSATSSATTVTVNSLPGIPTITAGGPTTFCQGDSVTLTSSAAASYSWSSGPTTQSINVNSSGSHTVTVTDGNGCSRTSTLISVSVNANPIPTITTGGPTTFCQGDNVNLTSSAAVSYLWSTSATTQGITVSTSGSYTVTVTDTNGCSGSSSATTVTVGAPPTIDLITSTDASACGVNDGTITITASGGTSPLQYSTNGGSTFSGSGNFSSLGTGNYDIAITDSVGCIVMGNTITITAPGAPTATAGADDVICEGSSYTLSGTMGGTASIITWSTSGTGTFDSLSLLAATYTPSAGDIGAGTVTLTITSDDPDGGGPCQEAIDNMVLTIDQAATVSAGADASICGSGTYTLSNAAISGVSGLTWSSSGTGTFDNTGTLAATYTASGADITAGTVTLTITTSDPSGPCQAVQDDMILTISQVAITSASTDASICEDDTYTLSGTMSGSASSISWTTSGNGTFDDDTMLTATYTPSSADMSAGSVTLTITTDNPAGPCTAVSDEMVLTINANPTKPIITPLGNNLSTDLASSYQWFLNGAPIASATTQFYTGTQTGFYTVTVTDGNGCSATSDVLNFIYVGIIEDFAGVSIDVYPNPNRGEFTVEIQVKQVQDIELKIVNLLGQIVFEDILNQCSGNCKKVVNLKRNAKGVYELQIRTKTGIVNKSIILK